MWPVVGRLQGLSHGVISQKDMCARCQVLADEGGLAGFLTGCGGTDVCHSLPQLGHVVGGVQTGVGLCGCEEFAGEAKGRTVDQLCNAATEVRFEGCPNAEENEGQNFHPILTLMGLEGGFQLAMKALHHAIAGGVVSSGANAPRSQQLSEAGEETGFKLSAPVSRDSGRRAEPRNPVCNECACHRFRSYVGQGDDFRPASKTVDASQKVGISLGRRQRSNNVYVDVVEPCVGWIEGSQGCDRVTLNFAALTLYARAGPVANILVDAGPHEARCYKMLGSLDSGVRKSVKGIKDLAAKL